MSGRAGIAGGRRSCRTAGRAAACPFDQTQRPGRGFAGDTLSDAFADLNPVRETPVLELDDGTILTQSPVILWFLAEGTPFLPGTPLARAQVVHWLTFEQERVMGGLGGARFRCLTDRATARDPRVAGRLRLAREALDVLAAHLCDRDWLVGHDVTIADVAVFAYTSRAGDIDLDPADGPRSPRGSIASARCPASSTTSPRTHGTPEPGRERPSTADQRRPAGRCSLSAWRRPSPLRGCCPRRHAIGELVAGVALVAVFVANQYRAAEPLMPLRLFADRVRAGAYVVRFLFNGVLVSWFFFMTQYLQGVSDFTPLQAGLAFLPVTVAAFAAASATSWLTRRTRDERLAIAGCAAMLIGPSG